MKKLLLLALFAHPIWAKPIVLIGHFDPFGNAAFNNSTVVAKALQKRFHNSKDIDLRLCELSTSFDKAFGELEACAKELPTTPALVLGIGETACALKIETMARNLDHTYGPDNDGVERIQKPIVPGSPNVLGITAPVAEMWCGLDLRSQRVVPVSSNAGSFVCNNMMYQYLHTYPEQNFSFIHVPSNNCRRLERMNQENIPRIEAMIHAGVKAKSIGAIPTTKKEINLLRKTLKNNCQDTFYSKIKGSDERGF